MRSGQVQKVAALLAGLLLVAGCAFPQQGTDTPDEVGGTYYVNGTDALEQEYGGQLIITPNDGSYEMQWIITGVIQTGVGDFDGRMLEGNWRTIEPDTMQTAGTFSFELQDDGSLIGARTTEGWDTEGYEEAFPVYE